MTLQEFIDFDQYVRCFTFGKTDIMPVAYDPRSAGTSSNMSTWRRSRCTRRGRCPDDQSGARLRDEHDRVCDQGRRAVRDRFPESGPRFRTRSHHAASTSTWLWTGWRGWSSTARCRRSRPIPGRGGKSSWRLGAPRGVIGQPARPAAGGLARECFLARRGVARAAPARRRARAGLLERAVGHDARGEAHVRRSRPLPVPPPNLPRPARRVARRAGGGNARRRGRARGAGLAAGCVDPRRRRPHRCRDVRCSPSSLDTLARARRPDSTAFCCPTVSGSPSTTPSLRQGFGYTERLAAVFDALPIMARFRERFSAEYFRLTNRMLDALVASYRDWGGTASPPTILIVDFHGVPTWTEFEILQARFEQLGVPTVVADPHEMSYEGGRLTVAGRNIDLGLPSRVVQRRPGAPGRVRTARRGIPCAHRVYGQYVPLQGAAQKGILRGPDRRAFPSPVHSVRARLDGGAHSLDASRRRPDDGARRRGRSISSRTSWRIARSSS